MLESHCACDRYDDCQGGDTWVEAAGDDAFNGGASKTSTREGELALAVAAGGAEQPWTGAVLLRATVHGAAGAALCGWDAIRFGCGAGARGTCENFFVVPSAGGAGGLSGDGVVLKHRADAAAPAATAGHGTLYARAPAGGGGDDEREEEDAFTKLLLHFDGDLTDSSGRDHAVVAEDGAVVGSAHAVFGGASLDTSASNGGAHVQVAAASAATCGSTRCASARGSRDTRPTSTRPR